MRENLPTDAPKHPSFEILEPRLLLSVYADILADINVAPANSMDDTPEPEICAIGNIAYFTADDGVHGMELWKTDGTEAGTVMVRDIQVGFEGSSPRELTEMNGVLYFAASGSWGDELYRSDGTYGGTYPLRNINNEYSGDVDASPAELTVVGNLLYFVANDGSLSTNSGRELWKTDGTSAGTVRVANLVPSAGNSDPSGLTNVNGTLFFSAWTEAAGCELWKVDASGAAVMVNDIRPGVDSSTPLELTEWNGLLYFSATDEGHWNRELWVSDGTAGGTVEVWEFRELGWGGNPNQFTVLGDKLFFEAEDDLHGPELWVYTVADGASMVKDINAVPAGPGYPEGATKNAFIERITVLNDIVIFEAWDGVQGWQELWISDGTEDGTVPLQPSLSPTRAQNPWYLTEMNGAVYFRASGGSPYAGHELWKTDGTEAGTVVVSNIRPWGGSSYPAYLTVFGNTLLFAADDGTHGFELWKSDGTDAGTVLVKDINTAAASSLSDDPETEFVEVAGEGVVFFAADNGGNGTELWMTDGTPAGTRIVRDPTYGPASISPIELTDGGNGVLYFSGYNLTEDGRELWKAYQTASGTWTTAVVKNINTVSGGSGPADLTVVGNNLFFTADDGQVTDKHGRELWKVNLTTGAVSLVADINPGPGSSNPTELTVVGNTLFFSAYDPVHGIELWKSDGTAGGTVMVRDMRTGVDSSSPTELTEMNGLLYFKGTAGGSWDRELWRSDGSASGTELVAELRTGGLGGRPRDMVVMDGNLYFVANEGSSWQVWRSDGLTPDEGGVTERISDIPGAVWASQLTVMDGKLYFTAYPGPGMGKELFVTDGTLAGTTMIDLSPSGQSNPKYLTVVGDTLYFQADGNDGRGHALWTYTEAEGPQPFPDENPAINSYPSYLTSALGTLIYAANDGTHGWEPWIVMENTAPVAEGEAYEVLQGDTLTVSVANGVLANDTDVTLPERYDPLSAVLVQDAQHGTLVLNADGSFTYTPDTGFSGIDSFTYTANDWEYASEPTVVTITVIATNAPPVANADAYDVNEDNTLVVSAAEGVLANDTDPDNDDLTAMLADDVQHGVLTLNPDGSFTYTPDENWNGTDSFTYTANDAEYASEAATVTITVNAVNDAPVAVDDDSPQQMGGYGTKEDVTLTVTAEEGVLANDSDPEGDALTAVLVDDVQHGVLTLNADGSFVYTPEVNWSGVDSFTYNAFDGDLPSAAPATVLITVTPLNDVPVVVNPIGDVVVDEDAPDTLIELAGVFDDADLWTTGDILTLSVAGNTNPGLVSATLVGTQVTLSYAADASGSAQITIRATDTSAKYAEDVFTVTVNPVNDAPTVAVPISDVVVDEDAPDTVINLAGVFDDVDAGDTLMLSVAGNSNAGLVTASIDGTELTLSYAADANGTAEITIRGTDSAGAYAEDVFTVTVNPVNDAPTADAQTVTVSEDGSVAIVLSGSDVETPAGALTFTITSLPTTGALLYNGVEVQAGDTFTGSPAGLVYVPGVAYDGARTDSFTFSVTDTGEPEGVDVLSASAAVTIDVTAAVDPGTVTVEDGIVRIAGTDGDDHIILTHTSDGQNLKVIINGAVVSDDIPLAGLVEARAWGRAGNDIIEVIGLGLNTMLHGGVGNDELTGGAGEDLIFGGEGDDTITGAADNDFLIGGAGIDRIVGSAGHDILVAGDVAETFSISDLRAVLADWVLYKDPDEGLTTEILDEGVLDEGYDMLTGSSGADWFIISDGDKITDFKKVSKDGDVVTYV